jgi:transporter family-2 protein
VNRLYSQAALALFAGAILAIMIKLNSSLAQLNSPLEASWIAHGLGAITALVLLSIITRFRKISIKVPVKQVKGKNRSPWYAYLGGLPGAFTVILAAITVNSALGLAGTLALALLGQIVFSLLADHFALFASTKRKLGWHDMKVLGFILIGSFLIIFARRMV